jgi:hypothetical protein
MTFIERDFLSSELRYQSSDSQSYMCVEGLFECASACWITADACLNEVNSSQLTECIISSLECAQSCAATAKLVIKSEKKLDPKLIEQLKACISICEECMAHCARHSSQLEHCLISIKCCEECIRLCQMQLNSLID